MRRLLFAFLLFTAFGCSHEGVSFDPRVSRGTLVTESHAIAGVSLCVKPTSSR